MSEPVIRFRIENGVGWLTLNRPDVRNAMNEEMREEIFRVLAEVSANHDCRALVVTGAGKGFCSEVFARRGLVIDAGGAYLLARRIGLFKAKELVLFGDDLPAREAERIGLANRCVPAAELEATAREWAERLAKGPTFALGLSKRLLNRSLDSDLETSFSEEAFAQSLVGNGEDVKEGIRAFMERREPSFKGR